MSFFESVREREIREIFQFWLERRCDGAVPAWHSITPANIPPKLLPHLFMYARETSGRFYCKLIGTALARVFGGDETGRYLDEILPPRVALHRAGLFQHVLDTARPVYYRGLAATRPGELRRYGRILLPVACSGQAAKLVFGMARFGPLEGLPKTADAEGLYANPTQILYAAEQDLDAPKAEDFVAAGKTPA